MIEDRLNRLLANCSEDSSCLPPTILYNEGWMLRLLLDWFSDHPEVGNHPFSVKEGNRWYSEALLSSQFKPRVRGDKLAESHTHADAVVGHLELGKSGKGDLSLLENATDFVVIEAKMFSKLSRGVSNAPDFDQAARNVACMAEAISLKELTPESFDRLAFNVVLPASHPAMKDFEAKMVRESMKVKVLERVRQYEGADRMEKEEWYENSFLHLLKVVELNLLSWESVIECIQAVDDVEGPALSEFYQLCLKFNGRGESKSPPH